MSASLRTLCRRFSGVLLASLTLAAAATAAPEPYACRHTPKPKFIDGRINEWTEPFFTIDGWNWRPTEGMQPVYGGALDLSATVRLAYDAQCLYAAVIVTDDIFLPADSTQIDAGDAVVLALAPAIPPSKEPVTPVEILFTLNDMTTVYTRDNDKLLIPLDDVRIGASRSLVPKPTNKPLPREEGKPEAARIQKLCYEVAIPWTMLPQIDPATQPTLGLAITVLDLDHNAIRGSLKWRGLRNVPLTQTGFGQIALGER